MKKTSSFKILMFLSIFMWIGANLHHPNTPTFFTDLNLPSRLFGTSFAVMCFMGFLLSPVWGTLTDKKGRIKFIALSCVIYGISQLFLSISITEMEVLLSRALSGVGSGGFTVGLAAYVVDISPLEKRAMNLITYTAVTSVGGALGYLIGGFIGVYSAKFAFLFQGVYMIILGVVFILFIQETRLSRKDSIKVKDLNPFQSFIDSKKIMSIVLVWFLVIVFFASFASSSYDNAFNYFVKNQLNLSSAYNGIIKAVIGIIGLISNFTVNVWLIRKTNVKRSIIYIISLCFSVGLLTVLLDNQVLFIILNIAFLSLNSITLPIFQTLAVDNQESSHIGIANGIFNAIKSLGTVFGALVAGYIYEVNVQGPFILGTLMFLLALIASIIYSRKALKSSQ